jgi:phosphinothricin acetyltransferase
VPHEFVIVEHAKPGDLPAILDILNHYILTHHATFDTVPWAVDQKQEWFDSNTSDGPYQLLVARLDDRILGYAFSGRWRPKKGYNGTAESTVYVHPDATGQNIGYLLMSELLERLSNTGLKKLVAGVAQPGDDSNRLHEKLGYIPVGTFHQVGFKFDKFWDVLWFEYDF